MSVSILVTCIIYRYYASAAAQSVIRPLWLFLGVEGIYIGHMIWSAELDFMNPQDALYRETGEGNISNPNETLSTTLAYVVTILFTLLSYFFLKENLVNSFYRIGLIGIIFCVCRIILFYKKIIGYRNSRGERGRD